jgi:replicative DNA helicase
MDSFLDKSLPSDIEAEQFCLGTVLLNNEVMDDLVKTLVPKDFYSPLHRDFYSAMIELHNAGHSIDPINISHELKRGSRKPASYGGLATITALTEFAFFAENLNDHIKKIKTLSVARETIRTCNATIRDLLAEDVEPAEVLEKAESRILTLNNSLVADRVDQVIGFTDVRDISDEVREQFYRFHSGESSGVRTGMKPLDDILDGGGLQGGASYLVAGVEKSGKTSLVLEWVRDIAVNQNRIAAVATLEMSKATMFKRLYSMHTGIPYFMFRPGFRDSGTDKVFTKAIEGLDKFSEYPIKIADSLFNMSQIRRYCSRLAEEGLKAGTPLGVVVLDYLQLINLDTVKAQTREREVATISREIKLLASELGVPVVVISALNRAIVEDGEPDTSNLRDSGMLAYDAEAIMFVHNPAYKPGKPYEPKEVTDIILNVARQRNGPTKRIPLKFIGKFMSFMTEMEFNKLFGHGLNGDTPRSKGEHEQEQQNLESIWEEDDAEWASED